MYRYKYSQITCPECNMIFTDPSSVSVHLMVLDHPIERLTQMDVHGYLHDEKGLIAQGFHSHTLCDACGHDLSDIQEEDNECLPRLWIGVHHHRHGEDYFPMARVERPGDDDVIDEINKCGISEFEEGLESEWVEVRGPYGLTIPFLDVELT